MSTRISRRSFLAAGAVGAATSLVASHRAVFADAQERPQIQGFDETDTNIDPDAVWEPFTDKKLRMGIVGYGFCQFGAEFGFQNHPNVEVVAVSDLFPDRCAGLAEACKCEKTYESLEEMIKDKNIDAIFLATDAPSHCDHACKVRQARRVGGPRGLRESGRRRSSLRDGKGDGTLLRHVRDELLPRRRVRGAQNL